MESRWEKFGRNYTKEEDVLIISRVLMIAVKTALKTHIYSFKNKLYRQVRGKLLAQE